ncbi:MAG: SDR family oxidoreductase [Chloroflexota bacterium]|nr:SDR family oxidoreductase [Chloroflexota bacterium]
MSAIALVTGANRGIGKEACRQLAGRGLLVLLTARDLAKAQAACQEIASDNVIAKELDVTDGSSMQALRDEIEAQYERLDVLVNNAAIHYDHWQTALGADFNIVSAAIDTNLYGPWRMIKTFAPLLKKSDSPRIVNVSSGSGSLSTMGAGPPAYNVSKTALNALTRMLAAEMAADGVLVNAICPGWVATEMGGEGGRPIPDGAAGIVWAATLPDDGPTGGFFRDQQPLEW